MPVTTKKSIWQRIVYSRITPILILGACLLLAVSVYERYTIEREMAGRRVGAEAELQALKERKDELSEKVEYLTAEYGVEAEMRKNFDVAKAGERVVIIVDAEEGGSMAASLPIAEEPEEEGFWSWLPW